MTKNDAPLRPHSDEYFGNERDFWWNADFLDLIAHRLKLDSVSQIADIGCGIGHWSALVYARAAKNAELIGVDRDPANVSRAREQIGRLFPGRRTRFEEGDVMALPLPDSSVDAATCQTLLIHVSDVDAALAEMIRITRPGGLVFVSEPNNNIGNFLPSSFTLETPIDELVRNAELAFRYALGRAKRGLGCEFIGDLLPGVFAKAGLIDIQVWLSDKASPLTPPYDQPEQLALLAALRRWKSERTGPFDETTIRDNVIAGGGSEELIQAAMRDMHVSTDAMLDGIRDGSFHAAGGGLHYIVAGRVPQ